MIGSHTVRACVSTLTLCGIGSCLVLAVAACGSGAAAPGSSATSTASTGSTSAASTTATPAGGTPTTGAASFAAYQSCLQAHGGGGFGFGRPPGTGTTGGSATAGATRPALTPAEQKARTDCASLRPAGGFGGGRGGRFNGSNPAFAKFQACLSQHGVQAGSPSARTSPAFQTALAACRSLLPAGGFGRGGGAPGGGGGANGATFAKYQACLTEHGIHTGAAAQSASKLQAAITACRSLLPNGGNASQTTTAAPTTTG